MFPGCFPLPSRGQAPFHAALQDAELVFGMGKLLDHVQPGKEGQDGAAAAPQGRGSCARCWRCTQQMLTRTWLESTQGTRQLSLAIPGSASE